MFSQKNVIVTGGANGIGRAVAEQIVQQGGHVILVDLDEKGALDVQREYGADRITVYQCDFLNPAQIESVFEAILARFTVHVLINSAGIISLAPFDKIELADWTRTININLTAVFLACQCVYKQMIQKKYGRIVNISSVAGKRGGGLIGNGAYAASKAGVIGLTKAIAREGAHSGVACNAVCPSYTETGMTSHIDDAKRNAICGMTPLGRGAQPREIANMVVFFASDLASYITGEIGDADGGIVMDG